MGKKMAVGCSLFTSDALLLHVFRYSKKFSGATVSTESCDVKEKKKQKQKNPDLQNI